MKKFVWVYAGDVHPTAVSMLRLSVISAHLFHPDVLKFCICPLEIASDLEKSVSIGFKDQNIDLQFLTVQTPKLNALYQSRWIKVRVYNIINDDCLYIDSDTLFVRKLDFSEVRFQNIGASIDRYGIKGVETDGYLFAIGHFNKLKWLWMDDYCEKYLNTGIILYSKSKLTDIFVSKWIENWELFRNVTGEHYDQIAFNYTSFSCTPVSRLPDSWNAPVAVLPQTYKGAKIFHYYASTGKSTLAYTIWGDLIHRDTRSCLSLEDIRCALSDQPKPYISIGASSTEYKAANQLFFFVISKIIESVTKIINKGKKLITLFSSFF